MSVTDRLLYNYEYVISRVVDGDGLILRNKYSGKEIEIRLMGIDAPEIKHCTKLKNDEKQTHLPAQFLIMLGNQSFKYLIDLAVIDSKIIIIQEERNLIDKYGRTLAYIILENGDCINQKLVEEGFAKPLNDYYCNRLPEYQSLNLQAKIKRKGLYKFSNNW